MASSSTTRNTRRFLRLLVWGLMVLIGVSCAAREEADLRRPAAASIEEVPAEKVAAPAEEKASATSIDPTIRRAALMSLATAHHKKADIALQSDDTSTAINEMNQLLASCESSSLDSTQTYDLGFDGATRLARLHLGRDEVEEAERAVERGLRWDAEAPPSLFKGYLHQVRADVLEKKKDLTGAVNAHTQAIKIFRELLELDVEDSQGGTKPGGKVP